VDAHLHAIPGVGSLSARGLAGGHCKLLGGHADRPLHLKQVFVRLMSTCNELGKKICTLNQATAISKDKIAA
jgi:hypothetical protein